MISFNNSTLAAKLIFNPYQISQHKQYYRFISSGFIHADFFHLLINMLVLYSFGTLVERKFEMLMGEAGKTFFVIYYLLGLIISILPTYFKQQSNYLYNGLGASGSVSAVLFSFILFYPWQKIYLYGILGIPGILAGVAYLIFSSYQDKKGRDNINHNAHFWGAIYGFVFPITVSKQVFFDFWDQLTTIHL
jgi:membrane associated rhomboid family serine protease